MREIDKPDVLVLGTSAACNWLRVSDSRLHELVRKYKLESRPARQGELRSRCRKVYLAREIEMLAALRKKYNNRVPW